MDRYAVFVDVGYVYAAGGQLVLDTPNRSQIALDHGRLIERVRGIIAEEFKNSGDFLRIYWYDAAPRGIPQPEHELVATHTGVKVRLGRLTRQGQKGVDSLVLRDMMRLSGEHAICTAFLLAGDEDLRQGVIEAQDYGVKVVLLGIQPTLGQNQAQSLIHETDELRILTYEELQECFSESTGERGAITLAQGLDAYALGYSLGEEWAPALTREEAEAIAANGYVPPKANGEIIGRLLEVGDLPASARLPESTIAEARQGFRAGLSTTVRKAEGAATAEPAPIAPVAVPLEQPAGPGIQQPASETAPAVPRETSVPASLPSDQVWAYAEGTDFGLEWLNEQPEDEVRYVRAGFPYLPQDIDVQLLRRLGRAMDLPSGGRIDDVDRKAARAGFWQALGMELEMPRERPRARPFDPIHEADPRRFGAAFARQWAERADPADVERARNLVERRIGLPSEADAMLLRVASESFGDPVPVDVRHRLRDGFGAGLDGAI